MNNFLCFRCDKRFTGPQSDFFSFSNSYGEWKGIKCPFCVRGNAKFIGNPAGLSLDIARNNRFTALREGRREHRDALLQPFRNGEFSKEFRDAHPEASKNLIKEGHITQEQYTKAKDVWKGDEL